MLTTTSTPRPAAPAAWTGGRRATGEGVLTLTGTRPDGAAGRVPCAARPSTRFVHDDGPCRCFFGGPAPLLAAPTLS